MYAEVVQIKNKEWIGEEELMRIEMNYSIIRQAITISVLQIILCALA